MRIRKIKEKDIAGAVQLMRRMGAKIDEEAFAARLHDFQYKRNHTVVVVWYRARIIALMHVGIAPSLMADRRATVFTMFIDPDCSQPGLRENLLAYAEDWSHQHGCESVVHREGVKKAQ